MSRIKYYYEQSYPFEFTVKPMKRYGMLSFLFDLFMIFFTCGLWFIWIFIREIKNR